VNLPFAGILEGALIGAAVGVVVGLISVFFRKGKPCPDCKKPLPIGAWTPVKECPRCGCRLNAKGEKIEDGPQAN
jgi:hypothetical protein